MAPWRRVPLLLTCVVFACLVFNLPSRQSVVVREEVGVARSAPRQKTLTHFEAPKTPEIASSPSDDGLTGVAPPPPGNGGIPSDLEGGNKQEQKKKEQKGKRRKVEEKPLKVLNGLLGLPLLKDYVKNLKEGLDELFYSIKPASLGVQEVEDKRLSKVNESRFIEEEIVTDVVTRGDPETGHSEQQRRTYTLSGCGCVREAAERVAPGHVILRRLEEDRLLVRRVPRVSTCNQFATARGAGQKVVTYSYYGNTSDHRVYDRYFSEIPRRAKEVAQRYPGWVMRVYYQLEPGDERGRSELCAAHCAFPHLDLCDVNDLPPPWGDLQASQQVGTLWRFVTFADPLVDVVLSRDLDSYILPREEEAVRDWLASPLPFHLMRDHPSHNGYILAGLWGARLSHARALAYDAAAVMVSQPYSDIWDYDQRLLRRVLWPKIKEDTMSHDSYTCRAKEFRGRRQNPRPFPTRRDGRNYTGFGRTKMSVAESLPPCPVPCRPLSHRDWTFC
ncbi:uncharacterized protein LOC125031301 [Penaeus chinensis]|uniref:uncharacterized protein LOC125031301 n=1 Tax=Penaeus chinensis TaxID=139456 RepID=UPI001FB6480D|nr:uncharacterized protein LOC125031301 [Penaeus chinensis]